MVTNSGHIYVPLATTAEEQAILDASHMARQHADPAAAARAMADVAEAMRTGLPGALIIKEQDLVLTAFATLQGPSPPPLLAERALDCLCALADSLAQALAPGELHFGDTSSSCSSSRPTVSVTQYAHTALRVVIPLLAIPERHVAALSCARALIQILAHKHAAPDCRTLGQHVSQLDDAAHFLHRLEQEREAENEHRVMPASTSHDSNKHPRTQSPSRHLPAPWTYVTDVPALAALLRLQLDVLVITPALSVADSTIAVPDAITEPLLALLQEPRVRAELSYLTPHLTAALMKVRPALVPSLRRAHAVTVRKRTLENFYQAARALHDTAARQGTMDDLGEYEDTEADVVDDVVDALRGGPRIIKGVEGKEETVRRSGGASTSTSTSNPNHPRWGAGEIAPPGRRPRARTEARARLLSRRVTTVVDAAHSALPLLPWVPQPAAPVQAAVDSVGLALYLLHVDRAATTTSVANFDTSERARNTERACGVLAALLAHDSLDVRRAALESTRIRFESPHLRMPSLSTEPTTQREGELDVQLEEVLDKDPQEEAAVASDRLIGTGLVLACCLTEDVVGALLLAADDDRGTDTGQVTAVSALAGVLALMSRSTTAANDTGNNDLGYLPGVPASLVRPTLIRLARMSEGLLQGLLAVPATSDAARRALMCVGSVPRGLLVDAAPHLGRPPRAVQAQRDAQIWAKTRRAVRGLFSRHEATRRTSATQVAQMASVAADRQTVHTTDGPGAADITSAEHRDALSEVVWSRTRPQGPCWRAAQALRVRCAPGSVAGDVLSNDDARRLVQVVTSHIQSDGTRLEAVDQLLLATCPPRPYLLLPATLGALLATTHTLAAEGSRPVLFARLIDMLLVLAVRAPVVATALLDADAVGAALLPLLGVLRRSAGQHDVAAAAVINLLLVLGCLADAQDVVSSPDSSLDGAVLVAGWDDATTHAHDQPIAVVVTRAAEITGFHLPFPTRQIYHASTKLTRVEADKTTTIAVKTTPDTMTTAALDEPLVRALVRSAWGAAARPAPRLTTVALRAALSDLEDANSHTSALQAITRIRAVLAGDPWTGVAAMHELPWARAFRRILDAPPRSLEDHHVCLHVLHVVGALASHNAADCPPADLMHLASALARVLGPLLHAGCPPRPRVPLALVRYHLAHLATATTTTTKAANSVVVPGSTAAPSGHPRTSENTTYIAHAQERGAVARLDVLQVGLTAALAITQRTARRGSTAARRYVASTLGAPATVKTLIRHFVGEVDGVPVVLRVRALELLSALADLVSDLMRTQSADNPQVATFADGLAPVAEVASRDVLDPVTDAFRPGRLQRLTRYSNVAEEPLIASSRGLRRAALALLHTCAQHLVPLDKLSVAWMGAHGSPWLAAMCKDDDVHTRVSALRFLGRLLRVDSPRDAVIAAWPSLIETLTKYVGAGEDTRACADEATAAAAWAALAALVTPLVHHTSGPHASWGKRVLGTPSLWAVLRAVRDHQDASAGPTTHPEWTPALRGGASGDAARFLALALAADGGEGGRVAYEMGGAEGVARWVARAGRRALERGGEEGEGEEDFGDEKLHDDDLRMLDVVAAWEGVGRVVEVAARFLPGTTDALARRGGGGAVLLRGLGASWVSATARAVVRSHNDPHHRASTVRLAIAGVRSTRVIARGWTAIARQVGITAVADMVGTPPAFVGAPASSSMTPSPATVLVRLAALLNAIRVLRLEPPSHLRPLVTSGVETAVDVLGLVAYTCPTPDAHRAIMSTMASGEILRDDDQDHEGGSGVPGRKGPEGRGGFAEQAACLYAGGMSQWLRSEAHRGTDAAKRALGLDDSDLFHPRRDAHHHDDHIDVVNHDDDDPDGPRAWGLATDPAPRDPDVAGALASAAAGALRALCHHGPEAGRALASGPAFQALVRVAAEARDSLVMCIATRRDPRYSIAALCQVLEVIRAPTRHAPEASAAAARAGIAGLVSSIWGSAVGSEPLLAHVLDLVTSLWRQCRTAVLATNAATHTSTPTTAFHVHDRDHDCDYPEENKYGHQEMPTASAWALPPADKLTFPLEADPAAAGARVAPGSVTARIVRLVLAGRAAAGSVANAARALRCLKSLTTSRTGLCTATSLGLPSSLVVQLQRDLDGPGWSRDSERRAALFDLLAAVAGADRDGCRAVLEVATPSTRLVPNRGVRPLRPRGDPDPSHPLEVAAEALREALKAEKGNEDERTVDGDLDASRGSGVLNNSLALSNHTSVPPDREAEVRAVLSLLHAVAGEDIGQKHLMAHPTALIALTDVLVFRGHARDLARVQVALSTLKRAGKRTLGKLLEARPDLVQNVANIKEGLEAGERARITSFPGVVALLREAQEEAGAVVALLGGVEPVCGGVSATAKATEVSTQITTKTTTRAKVGRGAENATPSGPDVVRDSRERVPWVVTV